MKLLTQSDDYGFTRGVACGILDAIEDGVVRNAGLFVNMPESERAASQWQIRALVRKSCGPPNRS